VRQRKLRVRFDRFAVTGQRVGGFARAFSGHSPFDEFLRQGAFFYLGEGQPLYIEIPGGNNPNYS